MYVITGKPYTHAVVKRRSPFQYTEAVLPVTSTHFTEKTPCWASVLWHGVAPTDEIRRGNGHSWYAPCTKPLCMSS